MHTGKIKAFARCFFAPSTSYLWKVFLLQKGEDGFKANPTPSPSVWTWNLWTKLH